MSYLPKASFSLCSLRALLSPALIAPPTSVAGAGGAAAAVVQRHVPGAGRRVHPHHTPVDGGARGAVQRMCGAAV